MIYFGTKLSENISIRQPEGYLLCLNVPVARTGYQDYLPEELGIPRSRADPGGMVSVYRPEEEVFSPETVASFEGMPVTNDHPADGVTIENCRRLSMGHAQNVRRGSGEESDLLLADLMIQDPKLIHAIMDEHKREISCGYLYELSEEDGVFVQRNIRGNHVAVVDEGRAGPRVSIKDRRPDRPRCSNIERRPVRMKKKLYEKLVRMARDGDAEAIEAVADIVEALTEDPAAESIAVVAEPAPAEPVAAAAVIPEEPESMQQDEAGDMFAQIMEKLDKLIELMTPAAADEDPTDPAADPVEEIVEAVAEAVEAGAAGEAAADPVVAEVAEIVEEILDPSYVLEPDLLDADCGDPDQNRCGGSDALRAAISAVRPALVKLPKDQRSRVCGDIAARLKKGGTKSNSADIYAALASARAKDNRADNGRELGKAIMASRNPHYQK